MTAITDEQDVIKGGTFYLFNKKVFTVALANTDWVDDSGEIYKFKKQGSVLFVRKLALGIGKKGDSVNEQDGFL